MRTSTTATLLCAATVSGLAFSGISTAAPPDHLIEVSDPVAHARDMVFDMRRKLIYVTTDTGKIERYHFGARVQLAPIDIGGSLHGIDIDPTHQFLIVAQGEIGETTGVFHRVDLDTYNVTDITYPLAEREYGSYDVKILNNGKALATTTFLGSGWVPLREIDLATNVATIRTDVPSSGIGPDVRQNTHIYRSGDRSLAYLQEGSSGSGPRFLYDASADTFPALPNLGSSNRRGSVNHDGSLIASHLSSDATIETTEPMVTQDFPGYDSGLAFDPNGRRLYLVDVENDEIDAYSSITWQFEFSIAVDEELTYHATQFEEGNLRVSPDGSIVALLVDTHQFDMINARGVIAYDVAPPPRVNATLPSLSLRRESPTEWFLQVTGDSEVSYELFASPDLVNWSSMGSVLGNSEHPVGPVEGQPDHFWQLRN